MTKPPILLVSLFLLASVACNDDGSSDAETNASSETANTGSEDPTTTGSEDPTTTGSEDPTTTGSEDPTGEPDGSFCIHQCSGDPDCMVGGQDVGLSCIDSVCTSDVSQCTGNEECVALFSGWSTPCTAGGGECEQAMQTCIPVGGEGLCAFGPTDFIDCATLGMEEIQTTDIDGAPVTVCGRPNAECNDQSYCFLPCESDNDCASAAYPVCNTGTGLCECGQDSDCATLGMPQSSVCNAGTCGCGSDQNCIDGSYGDVCNDGFCGCTGDSACAGVPNSFDGGMVSCVAL